jgi:formylglycine-generating enzyme required for sulfatase activity
MKISLLLIAIVIGSATDARGAVAFLVSQDPREIPTSENDTAREVAERVAAATPLWPIKGGRFVDRLGRDVPLERFSVIWCHQGDAAACAVPLAETATVAALGRFVQNGRGLLLTGVAAGLVAPLGVETLRTEPAVFGQDRAQAGLIPVATRHRAFDGIDLDRDVLWMNNAVYPAFAEFQPLSTPARGTLLARTPGGPENPLVEYRLGRGRVVVLAWRLSPHYHISPASYRANFERLAKNLLAYLGDSRQPRPQGENAGNERTVGVRPNEWKALELAIDDLCDSFKDRYRAGHDYRRRLGELKALHDALLHRNTAGPGIDSAEQRIVAEFHRLRVEAMLANPLLDFNRLLVIKRRADKLGLPMNYQSNSSLPPNGYDNEIAVLSPLRGGRLTTLFRPAGGRFVGDIDLNFDADRLLFSMPKENGRWRLWELKSNGTGLRELPCVPDTDVDNYDACYLPDGAIVFSSTAPMVGVPCVRGADHVANLFRLNTDGRIRQLTVEQDHDWCPTVLPSGRVLYLRWEYADIPHAFSRILFSMNPDGTGQLEYYGSNSYWPASMFYARPVPNHPTQFVAIVGGHHDVPRMGDLVLFDLSRGRIEAEGAVQRIPGRGRKVEPVMLDLPIAQTWPKFLHPWPLSDKYFLVSCKPAENVPWGIYMVDVFDNVVKIYDEPGYAMLEPVPLCRTPRPPILPDRVDPSRRDAEVFLADIYAGPGLRGVPRGTIKSLRLVSYHFAYQGMGGEPDAPGLDGPWDIKTVLGTVPLCEDGSARFRVPAYTPISLQPLDSEGKAVQLMRSWFTAMPGETVSCSGCHEKQNSAPIGRPAQATLRGADEIRVWYGPARGFDFRREVQPVLDKHCITCHDGRQAARPKLTDRPPAPTQANKNSYNLASCFTPSYYELRRLVRTPTRESDMHLLPPWEFHADTTRLVQMLAKGHYGVRLDAEGWDRLVTWIDLNAPAHGSWTEICGERRVAPQQQRRRELRNRYTNRDDAPETILAAYHPTAQRSAGTDTKLPVVGKPPTACDNLPGWPFAAAEARRRQEAAGETVLSIPLATGITLDLVRIPAGRFIMGQIDGLLDEQPQCEVSIDRSYWMGRMEITNQQYALFDPEHQSGLEYGDYIQFSPGERGWTLSRAKQPVVRVSWVQAMAFCRWLSAKTGRRFNLPSEAQWEYACRAGTATPLWYGTTDSDFSRAANLSDATHQVIDPFGWNGRPEVIPPWRPADTRFNDSSRVSAPVGTYSPNSWGLYDMHGNVAEWTRSAYRPYPYVDGDGRNNDQPKGKKVVRGGSWYDRPERCRSAFRQTYRAEQGVYDVGFRVICDVP